MHKQVLFIFLIWISCFTAIAQEPRLVLPLGHTSQLNNADFSPSDKYVFTAAADSTVKVWETISGKLIFDLKGDHFEGFVDDTIFVTSYLATDEKGIIRFWDLRTGRQIDSIAGTGISIEKDIQQLMVFTGDGGILVVNSRTRKILYRLEGGIAGRFLNKGANALTVTIDPGQEQHRIRVWDLATRKVIQEYEGILAGVSQHYLLFQHDSLLDFRELLTGRLVDVFARSPDITYKARLSADEKQLVFFPVSYRNGNVTSYTNNNAILLDVTSRQVIKQFSLQEGIRDIVFPSKKAYFFTIGDDGTATAWKNSNGDRLFALSGHAYAITSIDFSYNGNYIITASADHTARLWDAATGDFLQDYKGKNQQLEKIGLSPDGNYFADLSDQYLQIWETGRLKKILSLRTPIRHFQFSADSKYLDLYNESGNSTPGHDQALRLEVATGHIISRYTTTAQLVYTRFSGNKSYMAELGNNNTVRILDFAGNPLSNIPVQGTIKNMTVANNGKLVLVAAGEKNKTLQLYDNSGNSRWSLSPATIYNDFCFSPDDSYIMARLDMNNAISIIETATGRETKCRFDYDLYGLSANPGAQTPHWVDGEIFFSDTGDRFAVLRNNAIHVYDRKGTLLLQKAATDGFFRLVQFKDNNLLLALSNGKIDTYDLLSKKALATRTIKGSPLGIGGSYTIATDNNLLYVYRQTGTPLYSFFSIDSANYFAQIPSGYYMCTPGAAKALHYILPDLKILSFEQLDIRYNRPDKVLEALGNEDSALLKFYRKAYEKRIRKLNIDTSAFAAGYTVPEADFADRDKTGFLQTNPSLTLRIRAGDKRFKLDRFNVWVNEVPLYGMRGISIRGKKANSFDTTITLHLSAGDNRIETAVTTVNGTESYRMPLRVKYNPATPPVPKMYFAGIGINRFADSARNLHWSVKDIRDLAAALKSRYGNNLVIVDTLFDEKVTLANVIALKQKLKKAGINDKIILSYSGHGLLSKTYDYYLSSYAIHFNDPQKNGIPYETLENLLDSITARQKLMLIDACHSGEVDKEEKQKMTIAAPALARQGIHLKGTITESSDTTGTVGLQNSFELMQSLFVNVSKGTGATVISAAGGTEFAQERGAIGNGVFTYSILETMQTKAAVTVKELRNIVGRRVEQMTNGLQKPTSRNETMEYDWTVW